MYRKSFFLLILFLEVTYCYSQSAGSLDPSFNGVGYVTTAIGNSGDVAKKVLVQSDGKILVVGESHMGNYDGFAIVKYNPDGSLDNTFNGNGKVTLHVGDNVYDDNVTSAAIQSDGKIIVVGYSTLNGQMRITLVRFNSNGTIDATFDTDGIVKTSLGTYNSYANSIKILSDGKILVAGYYPNDSGDDVFCILKYNTNGSLDNTFDVDGQVSTLVLDAENRANDLVVQSDGKILVVGQGVDPTNHHHLAIVRYNSNGSLDPSFDVDGKVITEIVGYEGWAFSVEIQADGKILVAGRTMNSSDYDILLVRYNTDGTLDNTFNGNGIVIKDIDNSDNMAFSLSIQSDQKIVICGTVYAPITGVTDFIISRYNTDGSADDFFGNNGIVTTDIGGTLDGAISCTIQNDGKILVTGYTNLSSTTYNFDFALARYIENEVSIPEVFDNSQISISPNPTNGEILITDKLNELTKIEVYNIHGELVYQDSNFTNGTLKIDLSYYPSELYFFNLHTAEKLQINKVVLFK